MKYGYARVSTDDQISALQLAAMATLLRRTGAMALAAAFPLTDGGKCIVLGTTQTGNANNCYQTSNPKTGCTVTTCASGPRVADKACTTFIDAGVVMTDLGKFENIKIALPIVIRVE